MIKQDDRTALEKHTHTLAVVARLAAAEAVIAQIANPAREFYSPGAAAGWAGELCRNYQRRAGIPQEHVIACPKWCGASYLTLAEAAHCPCTLHAVHPGAEEATR